MTAEPGGGVACSPAAIAICIPVRNEEQFLPATLEALERLETYPGVALHFCFLLDSCVDQSGALIAEFGAKSMHRVHLSSLPVAVPNAGRARRAALAMGQAVVGDSGGILMTTDADTAPRPDWVTATCNALAQSDVVAGRIVREDAGTTPVQDRLERYYDRLHALRRTLDPVPWEGKLSHHHVGGASLAFRGDAYEALGGFRAIPSAEDATIVDEAHRLGLRVRRDRQVVVTTSSRRRGRALNGLADHLRALTENANAVSVTHPEQACWQYRGHALARAGFDSLGDVDTVGRLARQLGVSLDHILRIAADSANAEAFATCVVPAAPGPHAEVSLSEADSWIEGLEALQLDRAA